MALKVNMRHRWVVAAVFCIALLERPKSPGAEILLNGDTVTLPYSTEWDRPGALPACIAFYSWATHYLANPGSQRGSDIREGISLARARRAQLLSLARSDPREVLALAVPAHVRRRLPHEIVSELETRVSGIGDFSVYAVDSASGGTPSESIQRFVTLNGQTYRTFVYGRRTGQSTKYGIRVHGVVLDGTLVLHEQAMRILEPGEAGDNGKFSAEIAAKTHSFESANEMRDFEMRVEKTEQGIGPSLTTLDTKSWTQGPKNVLVIRVDFSDLPGAPESAQGEIYTPDAVQSVCDQFVVPYYHESSYGRTELNFSVPPVVYRMPQPAAYYATNNANETLHADARAAAAIDYAVTNYDRVVVLFSSLSRIPQSQINYAGFSIVGGSKTWLNGEFSFRTVAHEIGHTYGLFHADLWQAGDGNPISPTGTEVEYGDIFDTMSANDFNDNRTDFNPWFKSMLGWIPNPQVQMVITNGTYRLNRFDTFGATGTLALTVPKDGYHTYWIGCRRKFTDNPSLQHGAYIIWGYNLNRQSDLLDMTAPGTNVRDAALGIGEMFSDSSAGITIRPVAEGGVSPNEYLDIEITAPLRGPTITLQPANRAATVGQTATFACAALANPAPIFQWQRRAAASLGWIDLNDSEDIQGSSSNVLAVNVSSIMNGNHFQCVIKNSLGTVTTGSAALTLNTGLAIVTLAGKSGPGLADGPAQAARLSNPRGVAADFAGNVYVADTYNHAVRRIDASGTVTTVGPSGLFRYPSGLAVDRVGSVYVADQGTSTIKRIASNGTVTIIAGLSNVEGGDDGAGATARFFYPVSVAIDLAGNLYVADTYNCTIRKISPDGAVTTLAGKAGAVGSVDGPGAIARFNYPWGIAVDATGGVYVADSANYVIRKITPTGLVSTLAGAIGQAGTNDGPNAVSRFSFPKGVTVDGAGYIYVADSGNHVIRQISPSGIVTTVAGLAKISGNGDGTGQEIRFNDPTGLAVDSRGALYVADSGNSEIRNTPRIAFTPARESLTLTWPAAFFLQSATSMDSRWLPLRETTIPTEGQEYATITTEEPGKFFRLIQRN